jgi:hypothetical protein
MENAKDTLKAAAFNIEEDDLKGFEQINSNTMSVPFIRIIQKGSPQINREKPEFIQGAQAGEWFNTVTKDVYGDAIRLIVLNYDHIYIEWRPDREGFVGYHTVENAERLAVDKTFGKWKTKDGNLLQENYVYMVLIEGHESEGPMVLSLSSTAIKPAREWNRLMMTHMMEQPGGGRVRAKPYYLVWRVETEYKQKKDWDWYIPRPIFDSYVNEQQYMLTKTERLALPEKRVDYAQLEAPAQGLPETEF